MSAYGTKVVAVLDTQSALVFNYQEYARQDQHLQCWTSRSERLVVQPQNPIEGQLWFDKSCLK